MTSKHTKGKVRDFELTLEDAGRLADCLNSFDDSANTPRTRVVSGRRYGLDSAAFRVSVVRPRATSTP
ncbi:MAG: hypothetical protein KAW94_06585 [Candidatus Thorarchaeota archaeon]|nr:hypothetical protein [Candidatus Thorarchaeota archaeon]